MKRTRYAPSKQYRVKIRRDIPVKPEAEQLDGKVYWFYEGWEIVESDNRTYALGELAMIQDDTDYPEDAPQWIESGDLVEVSND